MRKILYILFVFITLSVVMSCGRSVDKRLVLADTLMWTNPDSSLAILNAINRDSLQGDENQAYYALLLTQAQFRCNIPLTSDTLISKAVDYYSDNHNREHYTRALLYKGGAYEDMNNPVEAIKWYKQAENNADTTDYRNLAHINMRLGILYFKNYASNNLDLNKFKMAAHYYEILNDKKMLMKALHYCGNVLRITDINSAKRCYEKGISIARELKDTSSIYCLDVSYALMYIEDSLYSQAKKYILDAYQLNNSFEENYNYYMLSLIYANQKDLDSAKYFISLPDKSQNTAYDSLLMYKALKEIALCDNNISQYRKFDKQYNRISNSLEYNETIYKLHDSEQEFDNSTKFEASISLAKKKKIISFLIGSLLLLSIVFLLLYFKKKKDSKRLIDEIRKEHISNYNSLREYLEKHDDDFSHLMSSQLNVFEEIMSSGYKPNKVYSDNKITHKIKAIDDSNVEFWNGLRNYLNFRYDGIIDKISKDYPILTDADINFIGLICCDFSDAAIAVCKGYRNTDSVRSRRRKIRDKMKIDGLLDIYLKQLMKHNAT
ncbi:MAG: hypothetical protein IKX31_06425 [Muribaculaceae bacterium]|nr:hypothetical protein [Muribaculaceae bacterium]